MRSTVRTIARLLVDRRQRVRQVHIAEAVEQLDEPWRERECGALPTAVVYALADRERLCHIEGHEEFLLEILGADILANGLQDPLEVTVDADGVRLRNGHHRVILATRYGIEWMPVVFKTSPRIKRRKVAHVDVYQMLVDALKSTSSEATAQAS